MQEDQIKKIINDEMKKQFETGFFTARKLTDTPTDKNQVVPRGYVTLNGTTANRPRSSVIGQRYFDVDLNKPVWVGNGYAWVDSSGSPA